MLISHPFLNEHDEESKYDEEKMASDNPEEEEFITGAKTAWDGEVKKLPEYMIECYVNVIRGITETMSENLNKIRETIARWNEATLAEAKKKGIENPQLKEMPEMEMVMEEVQAENNADGTDLPTGKPGTVTTMDMFLEKIAGVANAYMYYEKMLQKHSMHEGAPGKGAWGVSHKMSWHSGVHLTVNNDSDKVCAIADGVLIYARESEKDSDNKNGPLHYYGDTDNGCVVLRHTVEIGEGDKATDITFFSVYAHLRELNLTYKVVIKGKKPSEDVEVIKEYKIGDLIPRKTGFGLPGLCNNDNNLIHFELVCDGANLQKLIGRDPGEKFDLTKNGRKDAIYGDIHFYIKAQTPCYGMPDDVRKAYAFSVKDVVAKKGKTPEEQKALDAKREVDEQEALKKALINFAGLHNVDDKDKLVDWNGEQLSKGTNEKGETVYKYTPKTTDKNKQTLTVVTEPKEQFKTKEDLLVTMSFNGGKCLLTSYKKIGSSWVAWGIPQETSEYDLYNRARNKAKSMKWQVSPSACYELMRYGRIIGPDGLNGVKVFNRQYIICRAVEDKQNKDKLVTEGAYVDLADTQQVTVFSDADFPEFKGWSFVQDDVTDKNSRCDSKTILDWLDEASDENKTVAYTVAVVTGKADPVAMLAEREARMQKDSFRNKIRQAFLRIPSDWDKDTIEERWGWLKTEEAKVIGLRAAMTDNRFNKFKAHVEKMSFWAEAKAGNETANEEIKEQLKEYNKQKLAYDTHPEREEEYKKQKADYDEKNKIYKEDLKKFKSAKDTYEKECAAAGKAGKPNPAKQKDFPSEPVEPVAPIPLEPRAKNRPTPPVFADALPSSVEEFVEPSDCWHLPPVAFIEHMKKCMWLDKTELARIYPDSLYNTAIDVGFIQSANSVREKYRTALNLVMRKYLITTPYRMAHFLGQGTLESNSLMEMLESSVQPSLYETAAKHASAAPETDGYYADYNDVYEEYLRYDDHPSLRNVLKRKFVGHDGVELAITKDNAKKVDPAQSEIGDGMRFRGRGFKQITGRANYADYWAHRGWLKPGIDYTESWWDHGNKNPAPISDPQRAANDPYNAIDIGGHYFINKNMGRITDKEVSEPVSNEISTIINKYDKRFKDRWIYTQDAYKKLKD